MGYSAECVITTVDLMNQEPEATSEICRLQREAYFSWLGEGTLHVQSDKLPQPMKYPVKVVRKVKLRQKGGFEVKTNYAGHRNGLLLYHLVLPEYCSCKEASIEPHRNMTLVTHEKRQTVTWVHQGDEFKINLIFFGPDREEFELQREKEPRRLIIPRRLKTVYREAKTWLQLGSSIFGKG
jgi:hypothetical protein